MSSDDYHVQNICRYSRKTFKQNKDECSDVSDNVDNSEAESCVRHEENRSCPCVDAEHAEREMTSILHKKRSVIDLAQQQLQMLLDEADKLFHDNARPCRYF